MIRNSNGHEHHHRHDGMDEVGEPDLKPVVFRDGHSGLEDGEAPRGDEAIVDGTIGAVEAVSEVEEEAGEGTNQEEEVDHERTAWLVLFLLVFFHFRKKFVSYILNLLYVFIYIDIYILIIK